MSKKSRIEAMKAQAVVDQAVLLAEIKAQLDRIEARLDSKEKPPTKSAKAEKSE